ncbi:FtsQ-type POTRA domain-containing protein [Streptomyces sp. 891-h]|uniref:cell division protein FtsQ/DivIB n=1 Tax=Streptomyces sp. 891-h TaxID=2720714 RepID=UPI001FA9A363|nr:FtsQ-type POTRA domain-containing protein [Streptomyces sp. 891-h]
MVRAARAVRATNRTAERGRGAGVTVGTRPRPRPRAGAGGRDRREPVQPGPSGPRLRRRRLLALLLLIAVVLCGFGSWALYGSPWLRVESVSVTGNRVLTDSEVSRAAAVPTGEPLISVDKAAVQRRVRQELPRVRQVTAERSWPHGIALTVTERRPQLVMESAGNYVEVDSQGVRFATVGKPPKGVPLLVLEPRKPAGKRYFSATRLRREAARVTDALPDSVHRATRSVRVRSYDDISLELTGDRTVRWGSAEHRKAKAEALVALMKAAKDADHFDVSAPSAPAASGS